MNETTETTLNHKLIPLTRGRFAIVDADLFADLSRHRWHYTKGGYACRRMAKRDGGRLVYMHRVIVATPQGFDTDHINRNKLDNRRGNLRACTHQQNGCNSTLPYNPLGFPGVSCVKGASVRNKFMAKITVNGRQVYLGLFRTPELAGEAYQKASDIRDEALAKLKSA